MQNKTKATLTLAACASVAAGTLPLANSGFFFGLINHGFIAATIGGLADWFAVTALFHKPLGISYRTEILKRNRKRISDAVIEFVGDDLLNTKNIMETLKDENAAKLLIDFLENYNGRLKIKILVNEICDEVFANIDFEKISKKVAPIIEDEIKNFDVKEIIWYLGEPFYKKYPITFNFDSKTMGLYLKNGEGDSGEDKGDNNEQKNKNIIMIVIISIEVIIFIALIIVVIIMAKSFNDMRKQRINEINDDNYEYFTEKNKKNEESINN